jgi:GNAT superfamily N-acetyltransferase
VPARPPAAYPADLERDVAGDGLRYRVRPIRPDDGPRLVALHERLSPRSRHLRFFSPHPTLSAAEVDRFSQVDYLDRLALVATVGKTIIGVGRYDRLPGGGEAEVAFVVDDAYQHHGVGSELLDELADAALPRGVAAFRADTLVENRAMLDVFHHAGYAVTSDTAFGIVTLRFPITPTAVSRAARRGRHPDRAAAG